MVFMVLRSLQSCICGAWIGGCSLVAVHEHEGKDRRVEGRETAVMSLDGRVTVIWAHL